LNGQFVETRTNTALPACQEALVHTVIHISCGYENKGLGIKDLAQELEKSLSIFAMPTLTSVHCSAT
jgi:DNA-directed RNA polymerase sigma subunit (sigma70/sigma32)